MSLTVLYSGKQQQHCLVLDMRWISAAMLAFITLVSVISWQLYSYHARQSLQMKMVLTQNSISTQNQELEQIKAQLKTKLNLLAARVGTLQGQIGRLNALGAHLASKNNIGKEEFDFTAPIPMGGPVDGSEPPSVDIDDLYQELDQMERLLSDRTKQFSLLETLLLNNDVNNSRLISGKPVISKGSWLSSPYGIRNDPFNGKAKMHKGVDIAAKVGTEIVATGSGVVSWAGKRVGYGKMVELNHGDGLTTRYAHAAEVVVKEGDVIQKGQVVALMGNTGRSTGSHVHYEVLKNGAQINPMKYIRRAAAN